VEVDAAAGLGMRGEGATDGADPIPDVAQPVPAKQCRRVAAHPLVTHVERQTLL
jgi:hypothetical protein